MRRKHAEHVNLERWLVSYADFITLMFAFFVIMYAISKADAQKFKAVSQALRNEFGAAPARPGSARDGEGGVGSGPTLAPFERTGPITTPPDASPHRAGTGGNEETFELGRLADLIEGTIGTDLSVASMPEDERPQIVRSDRNVLVRLTAKGFYDQGSAILRADAIPVLEKIAKILSAPENAGRHIRVEGHTDSGPTSSTLFPSNWELSTARAAWIVRYLIQNDRLDPARFEVAGYAQYRPIAPNDTPSGRERNRRVEILILGKNVDR